MKASFILVALVLALFAWNVPTVSAQSCTSIDSCSGADVCCPLPPNGSSKSCMTRSACSQINSSDEYKNPTDGGILNNPIASESIVELLTAFVRGVVRIAAIFLVLAFVWVGFKFTAAQGNTEKLSEARTLFLWTVVGAAILLGAELIAGVVESTVQSISP